MNLPDAVGWVNVKKTFDLYEVVSERGGCCLWPRQVEMETQSKFLKIRLALGITNRNLVGPTQLLTTALLHSTLTRPQSPEHRERFLPVLEII